MNQFHNKCHKGIHKQAQRAWLASYILLLAFLSSLGTYAQTMVGDGFGGRAGYSPVNISIGATFSAQLCADKNLYIWGNTQYNRNNGTTYVNATPVAVVNVSNVRQYSLSDGYGSTYIKDDGTGYTFGQFTPYNTSIISNAYYTSGNPSSSIYGFVKTDGTVWAKGGTMGLPTCAGSAYCVSQVPTITNAKRIAFNTDGSQVMVILLADGTLQTIGGNTSNYPASLVSTGTPIAIPGLNNIVDIKASRSNFYALNNAGQVYAWGTNQAMGTGIPNSSSSATMYMPTLITFPAGAAPIKAISGGVKGYYAFALDENGNLYAWGINASGVFGGGAATYISTPVLVATNVRDMTGGSNSSYIIKNDNTIWGAGMASSYQLMNLPTGVNYTTYTQMNPAGYLHCAIASYTGIPPCVAGTTAPAVTPTTATNSCPTTTVNLASLAVSSTTPSGATLIWSTNRVPTSAADTLTITQASAVSTAGKYYALYYDKVNSCYSPADSVTITITSCTTPLSANNPAAATTTVGTSVTGNAATELVPTGGTAPYNYSNGSSDPACTAPSGATALPASSNLTVNSSTGAYSYTAPTVAGTYYFCIKVCDASNPQQCVVKTYTVTVNAAALAASNPPSQNIAANASYNGNAATELAPTGGTAPYNYSNGSSDPACTAPSGATALPASSNLTINSSTGAYSYTAPTIAGTYYFCIKVCDSSSPTPQCVVKTYTVVVGCAVGTNVPTIH